MGAGLWPVLGQGRWADTRWPGRLWLVSFLPFIAGVPSHSVLRRVHHIFLKCSLIIPFILWRGGRENTTASEIPQGPAFVQSSGTLKSWDSVSWGLGQAGPSNLWRGRRKRSRGSRRLEGPVLVGGEALVRNHGGKSSAGALGVLAISTSYRLGQIQEDMWVENIPCLAEFPHLKVYCNLAKTLQPTEWSDIYEHRAPVEGLLANRGTHRPIK